MTEVRRLRWPARTSRMAARRRLAMLASTAVLAPAIAIPAMITVGSDGAASQVGLTASAESVRAYYQAARLSLSPLIVHTRDLPTMLSDLAAPTGSPSKVLARAAQTWADDCSTARDLVSRLQPLPGSAGAHVATLYETAAMLHADAARVAMLAARIPDRATRQNAAAIGQHLYTLGDRMFDSAYRLLNTREALTVSELRFPAAVPDFGTPDGTAQPGTSTELTVAQAILDQRPPAGVSPYEAAVSLRLAALALDEARRVAQLEDQAAAAIGERVILIGDRIRASAIAVLVADGWRSQLAAWVPPSSGTHERLLFVGGVFNGNPPALKPGDEPGAGVPGGLPILDRHVLLGG